MIRDLAWRGVVVAAAVLGASACASGGEAPRVPEEDVTTGVVFHNTTQTCAAARSLQVEVADVGVTVVAAGERAAIPLEPGEHEVVVRAYGTTDATPAEVGVWRVAEGERLERWIGCAAPGFLRPGEGRVRVEVRASRHGCEPGLRGPAQLTLDGAALAQVALGERLDRWVAPGAHAVVIAMTEQPPRSLAVEIEGEGAAIDAGCPSETFAGAAVQPLTVMGPDAACTGTRVSATVAGRTVAIARGEAHTFMLPIGRHVVVVQEGDDRAPVRRFVDVVEGGVVITPTRHCDW